MQNQQRPIGVISIGIGIEDEYLPCLIYPCRVQAVATKTYKPFAICYLFQFQKIGIRKAASIRVSSELSVPPEPHPDRRFRGVILRIACNGCSMRASALVQDHAGLAQPTSLF
jgi:hypothetical protein